MRLQLSTLLLPITTRENFSRTLLISCFSFTEIAKRAAARMSTGGSMITLTFGGSTRVMPNYNVMGVAKAALEAGEIYAAIAALPDDFRDVLVAVDITGLSYKEAAKALRIREGTVMSRLYRARQQVVRRVEGGSV